jgi:hypothetical protein
MDGVWSLNTELAHCALLLLPPKDYSDGRMVNTPESGTKSSQTALQSVKRMVPDNLQSASKQVQGRVKSYPCLRQSLLTLEMQCNNSPLTPRFPPSPSANKPAIRAVSTTAFKRPHRRQVVKPLSCLQVSSPAFRQRCRQRACVPLPRRTSSPRCICRRAHHIANISHASYWHVLTDVI